MTGPAILAALIDMACEMMEKSNQKLGDVVLGQKRYDAVIEYVNEYNKYAPFKMEQEPIKLAMPYGIAKVTLCTHDPEYIGIDYRDECPECPKYLDECPLCHRRNKT